MAYTETETDREVIDMGTQRTSNKDIADKLDTLIDLLTAQAVAQPAPVAPATDAAADVELDKEYVEHMRTEKVQPFANKHGQDAVLYARSNQRGETKLAYCLADKFPPKDRGLIGAIEVVSPSAE